MITSSDDITIIVKITHELIKTLYVVFIKFAPIVYGAKRER